MKKSKIKKLQSDDRNTKIEVSEVSEHPTNEESGVLQEEIEQSGLETEVWNNLEMLGEAEEEYIRETETESIETKKLEKILTEKEKVGKKQDKGKKKNIFRPMSNIPHHDKYVKLTDAPIVIYFYQKKGTNGEKHMIPIRLPLENITTKPVIKKIIVYRKWKHLTPDERNANHGRRKEGLKSDKDGFDDEQEFPVYRVVPVIEVHGTVTVKTIDQDGNLIDEIHEAGFEYPEEYEDILPNIGGVYDDNYWERDDQILSLDPKKIGVVDNTAVSDILWTKGRVVKLMDSESEQKLRVRKGGRPPAKKNHEDIEARKNALLCLSTRYLVYCKMMSILRRRNRNNLNELAKINNFMYENSNEVKKKKKKIFFKNMMQYINTRDKFVTIMNLNSHMLDEECKKYEDSEQKVKIRLKELTKAETDLIEKIDHVEKMPVRKTKKEVILNLYKLKLEKMTYLKELHVNYLRNLFEIQHSKCNREIVTDKKLDMDEYNELLQKKKHLEHLNFKSINLLNGAKKSYNNKIKQIIRNFDEKERLVEVEHSAVQLDEVSDTEERVRLNLAKIRKERELKNVNK